MGTFNDAYYIAEVLKGKSEAFTPVVEKYSQMAFSLALKITRNREEAEEAAQDAFIKAFRSLENFRGNSSFRTWLFRIVYTTSISRVRTKHNNLVSLEDYRLSDQDMDEAEEALGGLTAEERAQYLHQAMDELAPDERAILNLYYFEDLPVDDIATIMDLSDSNVKIKLFRSRKKLYGRLHEAFYGVKAVQPVH